MKKFGILEIMFMLSLFCNVSLSNSQISTEKLKLKVVLGSIDTNPKKDALILYWPISCAFDLNNNLYVLDSGNHRLVKFNRDFSVVWMHGRKGQGPGEFEFRSGVTNSGSIAVDFEGNIYVVDIYNLRIQIFNSEGELKNSFKIPWTVNDIVVDRSQNVYLITSTKLNKNLVAVFNSNGDYIESFIEKLVKNPSAARVNRILIAVNELCETYVIFKNWPIIRKYDKNRKLLLEKRIDFEKIKEKNANINLSSDLEYISRKNMQFPPNFFKTHSAYDEKLIGKFGPVINGINICEESIYLQLNTNKNYNLVLMLNKEVELKKIFYNEKLDSRSFDFTNNNKSMVFLQQSQVFVFNFNN